MAGEWMPVYFLFLFSLAFWLAARMRCACFIRSRDCFRRISACSFRLRAVSGKTLITSSWSDIDASQPRATLTGLRRFHLGPNRVATCSDNRRKHYCFSLTNPTLVMIVPKLTPCIHDGVTNLASKDEPRACALLSVGLCVMPKNVLIVDDNAYIRRALCELFKGEAAFNVCGEAENGQEAIEKSHALHPDLVVLDLSMPVMNGLEAARVLSRLMPTISIIIFSECSDGLSEREVHSAGISAVVSKSEHASRLIGTSRSLLYPTVA